MVDQEYKLIRSRRRTLALEIAKDATLIIRAPLRMSMEEVSRFIEQKSDWIARKQASNRRKWQMAASLGEKSQAEIDQLKAQAEKMIPARAGYYAYLLGIKHGRVRITNAKTRWGACNRNGDLSFSWRLAMAPAWVVDYVIIHELIHILEHNHSRRYWEKVRVAYPEYKQCKQWLNGNQHLLLI